MVKVRAAGPDDKIEIERLTEMALGISAAGKGEEVPGAGRRIWLAWAGEGEGAASPAGFCRIVPDRESSARGWLCLDTIFVSPDDRRKGLGRALIEETKGAARSGGLVGVSAFLPANFPESFVKNTGGAKVRSLLLLRAENLETRPPSPPPPDGYRVRAVSLPGDLETLAALYNVIFSNMWNFRPLGPNEVADWFDTPDCEPADCLLAEHAPSEGREAAAAGMAVLAVDPLRVAEGDLTVYIPDIGVSPAHLRRGLGGALIAAAAERARARGLEALELIVDAEDAGARDFYQKQGFDELAEIQMFEWKAAQKG